MNAKLCEAIRNKRILVFTYKGKDRVVEPYIYGVTGNHKEILKGYQTGGKSDNPVPGWDIFPLSEIKDLNITKDNFTEPQKDYVKGDKSFNRVYCEL